MEEQTATREWVARWARTGSILAAMRRESLQRQPRPADAELLDALLEIGCEHGRPQRPSGMIEMQRLFRKLRP